MYGYSLPMYNSSATAYERLHANYIDGASKHQSRAVCVAN